MLDNLIGFSIRNKLIISILTLVWIGFGLYAAFQLPLDAVPDITNNQVQIVTLSPALTPQEMERFVTQPIEMAVANVPNVTEIRSISKFGLSIVTVVFKESVPILQARQLISEQLKIAETNIPAYISPPELMPITTGLGEIYQYTLTPKEGYENRYSPTDLRTIQDWLIKRQMAGIEGVVEISSFGGYLKQYEISVSPEKLRNLDLTINDLYDALAKENQNAGGGYIEKNQRRYYVRGEGLYENLDQIRQTLLTKIGDKPILIGDIAEVKFGAAPRLGAMTQDGKGEAVGGIVLMRKGENSYQVVERVKQRVAKIQKTLPEGLEIQPYLVRSDLISKAINTVSQNLIEGGLIVIFVLVLLLGNLRAGFVVASVIPLSMLFALSMMHLFGVSANLMSLGAIDFGLIVDGSVIIVENMVHHLHQHFAGKKLDQKQMDNAVFSSSVQIRSSAAFGEIIILMVYLPILTLVGIEGKMFQPMAQTVIFAILGAFILSLTYVPMMSAWILSKTVSEKATFSDKLVLKLQNLYRPILEKALALRLLLVGFTAFLFGLSLWIFARMGGEFIPTLEEGDLAMQIVLPAGAALEESVKTSDQAAKILKANFPEVKSVVAKIGTAEIPTDPMSIEDTDVTILLKPKSEWVSASDRKVLVEKMKEKLAVLAHANFEFTQPIELRFNELITGAKSDIAIKIYGEDLNLLHQKAKEAERIIQNVQGIGDLRVEQTVGLPQIVVRPKREQLAQYGLTLQDLNRILETAFAGAVVGQVFEGEKRFDLVVRFDEQYRNDIEQVRNLYVPLPQNQTPNQTQSQAQNQAVIQLPLSELAEIGFEESAALISRENTRRRITIGVNVRNRDVESLVGEISTLLDAQLKLPTGYEIRYGGQFENLQAAKERLLIAVPLALLLIFVLLYFTFHSLGQALLIFSAVPLSAIGGILALWLRDMPFSISAGVGFIALFGVAVLNGIVLIGHFNHLEKKGKNLRERVLEGSVDRLRPVLMTAATAALGFLPMAISTAAGAEVQKPLATVVIGGLITATFLTLFLLPIFYQFSYAFSEQIAKIKPQKPLTTVLFWGLLLFSGANLANAPLHAQTQKQDTLYLDLDGLTAQMEKALWLEGENLQIQAARKEEKTAFLLPKTDFTLQYGHINSAFPTDRLWQINQNLPFPTLFAAQKKALQAQTQSLEAFKKLKIVEAKRELRLAYAAWQHNAEKIILLQKQDSLLQELEKIATLRLQSGETDALETQLFALQRAQIVQERLLLEAERNDFITTLNKWAANAQNFLLPLPTPHLRQRLQSPLPLSNAADTSKIKGNAFLSYFHTQSQLKERLWKLEKQKMLPDLQIGAFNIGFEGEVRASYNVLQIGISIPLFLAPYRAAAESKRQQWQAATETQRWQQQVLTQNYQALLLKRQTLEKNIALFESSQRKVAQNLLDLAEKQYRAGATNYLLVGEARKQALQVEMQYLDMILKYNQNTAEILFFLE
ncbi:CusA/CzcA family heavy metal efflux RND transporter [Hugenholtzia roseola]|uniref:CusA/CzcA family heavy metal efflux RND transporter n=1 Tax=Hugenholtzia roseola TaxID=1002 RepID=UPI00042411EC|nr:CusA/CzcA family heavy metal efflux RND transporter [Hugenholtzia roseola]